MILSFALSALAEAAVVPLTGALVDPSGAPVTGDHQVDVRIWSVESGGAAAWQGAAVATFAGGAFSVVVDVPDAVLHTDAARWISVAVDGGLDSQRVSVGFAPRASWATNAGQLGGLTPDAFRKADEPVPWSAIAAAIAENLSTWSPGDGFILDGDTFHLSGAAVHAALADTTDPTNLGGDLFVTGAITGSTVSATGAVTFNDALDVLGAVSLYDNTEVGGDLLVEGEATVFGNLNVGGGLGVGDLGDTCGSANAPTGTLRYRNGRFEGCTSAGWVALTTLRPGTTGAPATSCAQIKQDYPSSTSGVYTLAVPGQGSFQAYCDMVTDGGGWTLVAKSLNDVGVSTWTAQANWNSCLTDTSTSSCGASARWLDKTITGTSYMIQNNNIAAGKKLVVRLNTLMSWWDMRGVPVLDPRIVHTYMSDVPGTTFVGYNVDSSSAAGCQDVALNIGAYRWSLGNGNTACGGTFSLFLYDGVQGGSVAAILWLR